MPLDLRQPRYTLPLSVMLLLCASTLVRAQRTGRDSTAYVTRLGQDTIAIERVISTRDSILGEVVDRYPRTERFTYAARLTPAHEIAGYTISFYSTPAANGTVTASMHVDFRSDTAHMTVSRGDKSQSSAVAVPPSAVPMNEPSYGILQSVVDRALASRGKRVGFSAVYLPGLLIKGSAEADQGDDTVRIETKYDPVRAVVDRSGHIQSFSDVGGTMQAIVTRTPWPDLARIPMRVSGAPRPVEQFTIGIAPSGESTGIMTFTWDTTVGSLPIHSAGRNGS